MLVFAVPFQLKELGCLCGLMPGRESEPTSKQLTLVVDLLGGMGPGEETGTTLALQVL